MSNRTADEVLQALQQLDLIDVTDNAEKVVRKNPTYVQARNETNQALLADILSFDVMQDDEQEWDSVTSMCTHCDFQLIDDTKDCICVQRNKLRLELRQALQDYFMGGDVGVDGATQTNNSLHVQSEQVKSVSKVQSKREDN